LQPQAAQYQAGGKVGGLRPLGCAGATNGKGGATFRPPAGNSMRPPAPQMMKGVGASASSSQTPAAPPVKKTIDKRKEDWGGGGRGGGGGGIYNEAIAMMSVFGMLLEGGGGGGWGGGGGKWKSAPKPLPADHPLPDKDVRYSGTVTKYVMNSGYGWVELKQKGVVPEDKVNVSYKDIASVDRYPCLKEGMQVELTLETYEMKSHPGKTFLRSKAISGPGGAAIAVQDEIDAETKTFVGSQNLRYSGTMKFYSVKQRYGYITMDDGYSLPEPVPKEIRVEHSEVNCGGKEVPKNMKNVPCEFGIYKQDGNFLAYNATMPGSVPFTLEALDNRQMFAGDKEWKGKIEVLYWNQGWGFIKLDPSEVVPPHVATKIAELAASDKNKSRKMDSEFVFFTTEEARKGEWLKKGMSVGFKLYLDDMGLGALDIHGLAAE